MTEPNAAIVEEYAEHLNGRAASSVLSFALVGVAGGAALGAIPGNLSHSLLAHGVNYFAVLLGALAGGIAGRSFGDKRATGLRLQGQLALRQLAVEQLLLQRSLVAAPAAVSAPAPAPALTAPAPPPERVFVPPVAPPSLQPVGPTAPPAVAPAPAPLEAAPPLPAAAPAPVPVAPAPPPPPRLVEQGYAPPPLSY
jgi:hypothetical protein